ncbi:hypothetical protein FORC47_p254 (plasmid) [Bacillus cereus]|nr:hypothetical protein FORC47_p254 [Bacillus cereus]
MAVDLLANYIVHGLEGEIMYLSFFNGKNVCPKCFQEIQVNGQTHSLDRTSWPNS